MNNLWPPPCAGIEARTRLKEDMLHMVEGVLKSQAPDDDFAWQVYETIIGQLGWRERSDRLRQVGPRGFGGFLQAFRSPNWRYRRTAIQTGRHLRSPDNLEPFIAVMKAAIEDPNKKVRRGAMEGLMTVPVDEQRKRQEFVPLLVARLDDPSRRIRRMAAWLLLPYYQDVPPDAAIRAFLAEPSPSKRWPLQALIDKLSSRKPT